MKNKIFFILILVLLYSFYFKVSANEICSLSGYTIVTINGIFTDEIGAIKNRDKLKGRFSTIYNNEPLIIDYFYNPTHLAGAGDLVDAVGQGLFEQKSDYDLTEILDDASQKVTTQKLLLIAHSQGNFYANNFYDKVASQPGGIPSQSIGVYGIGTPANRVAGDGIYITSDTDEVIASTVSRYIKILPPNVHIPLKSEDGNGHSFSDVYLKYQSDRIISNIKSSLDKLEKNDEQDSQTPCISPPELDALHKIVKVIYTVADPVAEITKVGLVKTYNAGAYIAGIIKDVGMAIGNGIYDAGLAIGNVFKGLPANVVKSLPDTDNVVTVLPDVSESTEDNSSISTSKIAINSVPDTENKIADSIQPNNVLINTTEQISVSIGGGGFTSSSAPSPDTDPEDELPEEDEEEPEDEENNEGEGEEEEPEEETGDEEDEGDPDPIEEEEEDIVSNILYSQPDNSTEISFPSVASFIAFTGKSGKIQTLKFAYNDHGNSIGHFIGLSVVDKATSINYYATTDVGNCSEVYESTGANTKIIVELDSSVHYKEYPCTGPELVLDPAHSYGVSLFRNRGGIDTQRFYGNSDTNDSVYLYITDDTFPSTGKAIKKFNFPSLGSIGLIDENNHRVEVTVPFGTDVTALTPTVKISGGASISPSADIPTNFTNPITYTVTAEDDLTQEYTVTVLVHSNVIYSQPDNSVEITSGSNVNLSSVFTGATGNISNLKFSYNDHGNSTSHFMGVQIVDHNTLKSYYATKTGMSCGSAYESTGVNFPVIASLDETYKYKEYPCDGPNLVLDPTHTYGVNLFRNSGGADTQRFYGSSNNNDAAYLHIESNGIASGVPDEDAAPPVITSYTFNGTSDNITINPLTNPLSFILSADKNVDWVSVKIEKQDNADVYKIFFSGTGCVDDTNTCAKTWDGLISGGEPLQDGTYRVKVHMKDSAGNDFNDYLTPYVITVNTSL